MRCHKIKHNQDLSWKLCNKTNTLQLVERVPDSENKYGTTTFAKGQLISKGIFGVFNSSKNEQKQVNLRYHSTVGWFILFVFQKNSGYQQVLSKLTDLYSNKNFSTLVNGFFAIIRKIPLQTHYVPITNHIINPNTKLVNTVMSRVLTNSKSIFVKRSQYISIKNPRHKQSVKARALF